MIETIRLRNFRAYEDTVISLTPHTLFIGQNNAGKSTCIEALRYFSIATERYQNAAYRPAPEVLEALGVPFGFALPVGRLEVEKLPITHRYNDPPCVLTVVTSDKSRMHIYVLSEDEFFCAVQAPDGTWIGSARHAKLVRVPRVVVSPLIAPPDNDEPLISRLRTATAPPRLAPRHFRNKLYYDPDLFERVKALAEKTWHGLVLSPPDVVEGHLRMPVRESFVGELANMGDELQIWLQSVLFICGCPQDAFVVLDEPDVYLHPDMQRRIARLIQSRFSQTLIATHSVEILAEYLPEHVLIVDKKRRRLKPMGKTELVSKVLELLGSVHNLSLSRLTSAGRFILVEGNDLSYLAAFHKSLYPDSRTPLSHIPHSKLDGRDNWQHGIAISKAVRASGGSSSTVQVYCILDGDFRPPEERESLVAEGIKHELQLAVLERKEIENYLLVPAAITRLINISTRRAQTSLADVQGKLLEITDSLRQDVVGGFILGISQWKPSRDQASVYKEAERLVADKWTCLEDRLAVSPGKKVLKAVNSWAQREFGVSINYSRLAYEVRKAEMPDELRRILRQIEQRRKLL